MYDFWVPQIYRPFRCRWLFVGCGVEFGAGSTSVVGGVDSTDCFRRLDRLGWVETGSTEFEGSGDGSGRCGQRGLWRDAGRRVDTWAYLDPVGFGTSGDVLLGGTAGVAAVTVRRGVV